jgi:hypothetical protein
MCLVFLSPLLSCKMKKNLITLLLIVICFTANAQFFEGAVTYRNAYKTKIASVTDDQFSAMMGTIQHYYIKGGDYKSEMNGTLMLWQLYINKDNKIYTKMANSPSAMFNEGSVNTDEVVSAVIKKDAETVLGYKCDELIITTKNSVQKYYYTSKFPVNGKLFTDHKFGNWDVYMQKANAVPLKIIMETPQFSMESLASEVKATKLEDSLFTLPAGMQVTKSPY